MSFDHRDIRRKMDVYTSDSVYLGNVLRVTGSRDAAEEHRLEGSEAAGNQDAFSGELMGPMPTRAIGNAGPLNQVKQRAYASRSDGANRMESGMIVAGKYWGLAGRHTIPISAIQTVSMERIILRNTWDELRG